MRRVWTDDKIALIVKLRDEDELEWSAIGERFGVSGSMCCTRYHRYKAELRIAEKRKELAQLAQRGPISPPPPVPAVVEAPPPVMAPLSEKRPRYFHDGDQFVRARIEKQGITAGVFGDPPKGRSALDQREGSQ